jgi:hypothetical protein
MQASMMLVFTGCPACAGHDRIEKPSKQKRPPFPAGACEGAMIERALVLPEQRHAVKDYFHIAG